MEMGTGVKDSLAKRFTDKSQSLIEKVEIFGRGRRVEIPNGTEFIAQTKEGVLFYGLEPDGKDYVCLLRLLKGDLLNGRPEAKFIQYIHYKSHEDFGNIAFYDSKGNYLSQLV